jgi:hypothetical protein
MKKMTKKMTIALGLLAALSLPVTANEKNKADTTIELRLAGKQAGQPVFQLNIGNADRDAYFITIRDQDGILLHEETLKGEKISRRFQLNTDELQGATLHVQVKSRKATEVKTFEIKVNTRQVQEAEIVAKSGI